MSEHKLITIYGESGVITRSSVQTERIVWDWQPIATAPKDGYCLVYCPRVGERCKVFMAEPTPYGWVIAYDGQSLSPTHWLPLPEPPPESA